MSADNWTICPRCHAKDEAAELLGDIPSSMREDWELGTNKRGMFEITYRCYCSKCRFKWSYDFHVQVLF